MNTATCEERNTSQVVDAIVEKHEAFFKLISQAGSLSRDEQLALLHAAIPSSQETT